MPLASLMGRSNSTQHKQTDCPYKSQAKSPVWEKKGVGRRRVNEKGKSKGKGKGKTSRNHGPQGSKDGPPEFDGKQKMMETSLLSMSLWRTRMEVEQKAQAMN